MLEVASAAVAALAAMAVASQELVLALVRMPVDPELLAMCVCMAAVASTAAAA